MLVHRQFFELFLITIVSVMTLSGEVPTKPATIAGLTTVESQIVGLVNGTNVYNYDL